MSYFSAKLAMWLISRSRPMALLCAATAALNEDLEIFEKKASKRTPRRNADLLAEQVLQKPNIAFSVVYLAKHGAELKAMRDLANREKRILEMQLRP